jgi:hypothetical protein
MATDYEGVKRDNIEEYGKGTRHLEFLGRLYSDKTHFIYELLQNAEDARASKVSFLLEPNRLIFKHDGKEMFNEKHVRGVCGVAEGTKAEDDTKIGKFGIGFKSVYAYTRTPEIHCGDEHFRIEHFVRPTAADQLAVASPWTTLFIFPFAQEAGAAPAQAFAAIKQRLSTIGVHTLLFLRNLRGIQWEVTGGAKGLYRSHSTPSPKHRRVNLKTFSDTAPGASAPQVAEDWLVFERPLSIPGKTVTFNVEAAFRLVKDPKIGKESIQRLTNAPLVVYFPTAIQTGLGFLIQGPYRTTPARDNIEEDHPLNRALLSQTGELIVEALRTIKDMDLLTIEVLSALPLKQALERAQMLAMFGSIFGSAPSPSREEALFAPITDRVAQALKEEELLPAYPDGFVAGNAALLARTSELRELLTSEQLQALLGTKVRQRWLTADITADRTASLRAYLITTIGLQELTPEVLAQKITKEFLLAQSDDWFVSFYTFLTGQRSLWREAPAKNQQPGPLRCDKPMIRLEDKSLVPPFRQDGHPNAFLPPDGETQFPTVKRTIVASPKAKEFLVALGLTPPDLVDEVIETVLVKYAKPSTITHEENLRDLTRIAAAAKTDSKSKRDRLLQALRDTNFLLCKSTPTGKVVLQAPAKIHFDSPELRTYFLGNPTAHFLFEGYDKALFDFFAELGVANQVRCQFKPPGHNGHVAIRDYHSSHERGLNGFDPGFEVEGLEFAISHPTLERSKYIWNHILVTHAARLRGEVEESSRQDFTWSRKAFHFSEAAELAFLHEWLPDRAGNWHRPRGYSFSELPDGFLPSEAVCRHFQMEFVSVSQLAEKTGIPLSDLETLKTLIQTSPHAWEQFKQSLSGSAAGTSKPKFPQRTVGNSERHLDKVSERAGHSPERTYEPKERSVRTSKPDLDRHTWLMNQYTNEDGQMICQMCESEMPFKKRDLITYYFEAIEAFDHLSTEQHQLSLALCPLCAAIYKEYVKCDDTNSATFKTALLSAKEPVVPVQIGLQQKTLRFVETHIFELRAILGGPPPEP